MIGWANEMVQQNQLNFLRLSFLIAGHTKFSPDLHPISEKFSKLPEIRSLHDFVCAKSASGVVATMRILCYTGLYEHSTSNVLRGRFFENYGNIIAK